MVRLVAQLCLILLLVPAACAQDDQPSRKELLERLEKLEKLLDAERERGTKREKRIRELEESLRETTDALARSADRRRIEEDIDRYLAENLPQAQPAESASRLNIGAVIAVTYRATFFTASPPRDTNTFELEDRYIRLVYRFNEQVTARFYTNGALAEIEYIHSDPLQVNFGRVLVPFGQFNRRSFPDTFDTITRPLLYLSGTEVFLQPINQPRPVFNTIYSDNGLVLSGNVWGDEKKSYDQIYYAVFVTNGLTGATDLAGGSSNRDNNQDKQFGARGTFTTSRWIRNTTLGFGLSAMTGQYDANDRLDYRMYGVDLLVVLNNVFTRGEGSLTFRAEYVYAPREILVTPSTNPTTMVEDANRTQGAYLLVEARVDTSWMVYFQFDWLSQNAPLIDPTTGQVNPALPSMTTAILRYTIGVNYRFKLGISWRLEYAYWDFDLGAPDAHRLSTQVVVPF